MTDPRPPTILDLPDEILDYIVAWLHPASALDQCARVNARWARVVQRVLTHLARELPRAIRAQTLVWRRHDQLEPDSDVPAGCEISPRYSHCAVFDEETLSMYVFGGCTSSSTTFNDLWKFDLSTRKWNRPLSTGTYPSPKACSVMVLNNGLLYLFGGWTHPSLYPLHQSWRLFNELHCFNTAQNRWTQVTPSGLVKPPAMAGHSATVHGEVIVVFGGLQKQRNMIGQFGSSNDVWYFNTISLSWNQADIPTPRPKPRYGQSQMWLDENHLMILGGCGGPNNLFNDVWVLAMGQSQWRWISIAIKNEDRAPNHLWCHPACKVDGFAVILGKRKVSAKQQNPLQNSELARDHQWNMIPQARHGVNRGYGSVRVRNPPLNHPSSDDSDGSMDTSEGLAIEPSAGPSMKSTTPPTFKSSVTLKIEANQPQSPTVPRGSLERQSSEPDNLGARPKTSDAVRKSSLSQLPPAQLNRLQAFSLGSPSTYQISSLSANGGASPASPANPLTKQMETRQRQLEAIKRMEDRIKRMGSGNNSHQEVDEKAKVESSTLPNKCICHRLSAHVLDIGLALSHHEVTWVEVKGSPELDAPEETILYSLVKANTELILFGGIQKDISSMSSRSQPASASDTVSNSLFYLVPPTSIG